jgi:hypothetical protein
VPLFRNRHPLNVSVVTLAAFLLPLLGSCREKVTEEPKTALPSYIEAPEKKQLAELRSVLFPGTNSREGGEWQRAASPGRGTLTGLRQFRAGTFSLSTSSDYQ